jgi:hypothetical protein
MERDFKNTVVMNYGYVFMEIFDESLMEAKKELTKDKWFNYVVSDDVIDSLNNILHSEAIDNSKLKKIVYDDVINTRNVIYSSLSEEKAIEQASKSSENCLILELQ